MAIKVVGDKFGVVAAQALKYSFVTVPVDRQREGQKKAILSFGDWLTAVVNITSQPKGGVQPVFHIGGRETCDALRIDYDLSVNGNQVNLSITQTISVMVIVATLREWPLEWRENRQKAATIIARKLFQKGERVDLAVQGKDKELWFGEQIRVPEKPVHEREWIDTIQWWSSDHIIGFVITKSVGADSAAFVSKGFMFNQKWFELGEGARYQ